jgi:hypothetical protein
LVSTNEQRLFLFKALKETLGYNVKTHLQYRASRDGFNATDYHRFCDEKGPTVVLIMTKNNVLCGGFHKISIQSSGSRTQDPHCFLFSLKTLTKYPVVHSSYSTCFDTNLGPWFGGGCA